MNAPLPPPDPKPEPESILNVEEPDVGLPLQFILAIMLTQGLAEIRISKAMMQQATDKLFIAFHEGDDLVVRIQR